MFFLSVTYYWLNLILASTLFSLRVGDKGAQLYLHFFSIFSVVRQVDGTLVKRYKHPGPVYGCDWSLNNRCMSDLSIKVIDIFV